MEGALQKSCRPQRRQSRVSKTVSGRCAWEGRKGLLKCRPQSSPKQKEKRTQMTKNTKNISIF
eukprot:4667087-Amphidinium_carterae.1